MDELDFNKPAAYFLILIVGIFLFFLFPGTNVLGIMEARNFTTAREMINFNNWLVPTMNGEPRLEKPPLPTWVTAFWGIVFGMETASLRIPAAIMALLFVIAQYELAYRLLPDKKFALIAALVLAASFQTIQMGRKGTWDIFCHSFMLIAIYFLYTAWQTNKKLWNRHILAGIFLGFAFLSKGPIPFYAMLLPFFIAFLTVFSFTVPIKHLIKYLLVCIALCIIIGCSWYMYLYISEYELIAKVAQKESTNWISHNTRPFWYYIDFPAQMGIWAILLISSLIFPYLLKKISFKKEYKFTLIWLFSSLILLSLFPEKKPRYLLPVGVPAALMVALWAKYLMQAIKDNKLHIFDKISMHVNFWILALITFSIPVITYFVYYQKDIIPFWLMIIIGLFFWGNLTVLCWSHFRKKFFLTIICMIDLLTIAILLLLQPINATYIQNPEYSDIEQIKKIKKIVNLPYYTVDETRIELIWKVGKRVRPKNVEDNNFLDDVPFVLFSSTPIESALALSVRKQARIEHIGIYDNNEKAPSHKRYNKLKRKYVVVVHAKE